MLRLSFQKDSGANPYYFNASQLGKAAEVATICEEFMLARKEMGKINLAGGHRNPTGQEAVLTVSLDSDSERSLLGLLRQQNLLDSGQVKAEVLDEP